MRADYSRPVNNTGRYGVAEKELEMMLDEVVAAVERWPEFARVAGVRGAVRTAISRAVRGCYFYPTCPVAIATAGRTGQAAATTA
jgi:hypothetical protein